MSDGEHVIKVDDIVQDTREDAEEKVWLQVEQTCERSGLQFEQAGWIIKHLVVVGGN